LPGTNGGNEGLVRRFRQRLKGLPARVGQIAPPMPIEGFAHSGTANPSLAGRFNLFESSSLPGTNGSNEGRIQRLWQRLKDLPAGAGQIAPPIPIEGFAHSGTANPSLVALTAQPRQPDINRPHRPS
jgi:hypothetical protein